MRAIKFCGNSVSANATNTLCSPVMWMVISWHQDSTPIELWKLMEPLHACSAWTRQKVKK